jgi:Flp pilus assembly protein TadG
MKLTRLHVRLNPGGKTASTEFFGADGGSALLLFSLAIIPIMLLLGVAVDYARVAAMQNRLHAAADNAALAAVQTGLQQLNAGNGDWSAAAVQAGQNAFLAGSNAISGLDALRPQVVVTQTGQNVTAQVSYTAQASSALMKMAKMSTVNLANTAVATTAPGQSWAQGLPHYNVSLVLDVSPSMAVGATARDVANLQRLTASQSRGACSLACHDVDGGDTVSNYVIARNNNVTLRMDIVKSAAQSLADYVSGQQGVAAQYAMGLYTISHALKTLVPPTTSLSRVAAAVNNVDFDQLSAFVYSLPAPASANIASGVASQRYADTDFGASLSTLAATLAANGTGAGSASPKQLVILVTDGMSDVGTAYNRNVSETFDYPHVPAFRAGNAAGRITSPLDPGHCSALKAKGASVAVLYVTYAANASDPSGDYRALVQRNAPPGALASNLSACASAPNLFYEASDQADIAAGLKRLFKAGTQPQMVHLVR